MPAIHLTKAAAKEVSYLVAKWSVKYAAKIYGSALNYKDAVEFAVIPNKIGKILISSTAKAAIIAPLKFVNTFALFPQMHVELASSFDRWKKTIDSVTLVQDKEKLVKQMTTDLNNLMGKWNAKIGLQSWIDLLTFFIPIPFAGVF